MVVPCVTAGAVGSAGATALGLQMGKTDLDLTRDLFKQQMCQAKRLWTADWAEQSVRHSEACMQSAQQHSESQAMATATYFQAEKIASQSFKLARDQDSRAYEMSFRAEVRECLRDELSNQNNRYNIIMLCDTVCLSCVFSLVAESSAPEDSNIYLLCFYVFSLGLSITLFSISLWCAVIVVRRLHEHTAAILERKLFAQSGDLQDAWQYQLQNNLPTGPNEMHLVNKAYEQWVGEYLDPIGRCSIHMLSIGVVAMFITAGLVTHLRYMLEYSAPSAAFIFWSMVAITSGTVLWMKFTEDRKEKKKLGVYDISWQDQSTLATGPYGKIIRAAEALFSDTAAELASSERAEALGNRERVERNFCVKTNSLHKRVELLRKESEQRAKIRKDILQLLTTAAEELDALPEDLIAGLTKILHNIDEADHRTADLITMKPENMLSIRTNQNNPSSIRPVSSSQLIDSHPIDAQRLPVSLTSLRMKLGEISHTTLLRIRNTSDEPLRLKSGVQLKEGKYIKSLNTTDPNGNSVCYHLYPITEIPPRSEVAIVARNRGNWVPTSGIQGCLVYVSRDETWAFRINFRNQLIGGVRKCQVEAVNQTVDSPKSTQKDSVNQYWQISKEVLDRKANSEVVISIDLFRGEEATRAESDHRLSKSVLKAGFLLKNKAFGLRLQWYRNWFELTSTHITYSASRDQGDEKKNTIPIHHITDIRRATDITHKNVFEICTSDDIDPIRLSAASPAERDDWIKKIIAVTGIGFPETPTEHSDNSSNTSQEGIECVEDSGETTMYPV